MVLADIPEGSHAVTLKMDGYRTWDSAVNVAAGTYAEVSGILTPGSLPAPTTKSPTSPATIFAALGICGAVLLFRRIS